EHPAGFGEADDQFPLEELVDGLGPLVVAEDFGSEGQSELCGTGPAVTPFETVGGVVPQVEAWLQRTWRLSRFEDDDDGLSTAVTPRVPEADEALHDRCLREWDEWSKSAGPR